MQIPGFYQQEKVIKGFDLIDTQGGKCIHKFAQSLEDLSFLDDQLKIELDQ